MSRIRSQWVPVAAACALAMASLAADGATPALVFCAPGYPSNTAEAAPTMEAFAEVVSGGAGRAGGLVAEYHPEEASGLARLQQPDAILAFVTLPFYLKHHEDLGLKPILYGVQDDDALEAWALVAAVGRIRSADDLAGWEIAGTAGYAPGFVRGTALGAWGTVPDDTRITYTSRVLSALRKTARGDDVAVLLDGPQIAGLDRLPFSDALEVVTRSSPVPSSMLCTVGGRIGDADRAAWTSAFSALGSADAGREVLESVRLTGFVPVDPDALAVATRSYDAP